MLLQKICILEHISCKKSKYWRYEILNVPTCLYEYTFGRFPSDPGSTLLNAFSPKASTSPPCPSSWCRPRPPPRHHLARHLPGHHGHFLPGHQASPCRSSPPPFSTPSRCRQPVWNVDNDRPWKQKQNSKETCERFHSLLLLFAPHSQTWEKLVDFRFSVNSGKCAVKWIPRAGKFQQVCNFWNWVWPVKTYFGISEYFVCELVTCFTRLLILIYVSNLWGLIFPWKIPESLPLLRSSSLKKCPLFVCCSYCQSAGRSRTNRATICILISLWDEENCLGPTCNDPWLISPSPRRQTTASWNFLS